VVSRVSPRVVFKRVCAAGIDEDTMMKTTIFPCLLALALVACGETDTHVVEMSAADHDGMDHALSTTDDGAPLADDGVMPVIDVRLAWMRPHPQGRDVTAAYFVAGLSDGQADRLVEARIDGAERVELHGHTMDDQGMMRMRPVGPQRVAAETPLVFAPGGLHLMVHGLAAAAEGDTATGVLVFERAGEVPVVFAVQAAAPAEPTEH
jgi:copper(I)-binding protein